MSKRSYRKQGETRQEAKQRFWEEFDPDGRFREMLRERTESRVLRHLRDDGSGGGDE